MNTNYQQTTTNGHSWTSNQKFDVLFLLPTLGNYKEHQDCKKHLRNSSVPNKWWEGGQIVGRVPKKVSSIDKQGGGEGS